MLAASSAWEGTLMDITNKNLLAVKGILFLFLGLLAGAILIMMHPDAATAALLIVSVWAFCRFYYFMFYVIEHYMDPGFKCAGFLHFAQYMLARKWRRREP
jgi:hypothetical protein